MIAKKMSRQALCLLAMCMLLCSIGGRAKAQTSNTCYLAYAFYGPPGDYKIELFEVGAPYPSRQDYLNNYNGQFTYRNSWSYISVDRRYFIRVTRSGGPAKQTFSFGIYGPWDVYHAPALNWYAL